MVLLYQYFVEILVDISILTVIFSGIAAFTGVISMCLVVKKWWEQKRDSKECEELLSNPFEIHFLIPHKEKYKVNYAKQDEEEHLVEELTIRPDAEDVIFVWIKPKISVELGEKYFGFESEKKGEKKPEIKYYNPFVKEQSRTPDYYIDWHEYYHLFEPTRERLLWQEREVYVLCFKIKTLKRGNYTFQAIFHISRDGHKSVTERRYKVITKKLKLIVRKSMNK